MGSLARLTRSFQMLNARMSMTTRPSPGPGAHGFSEKGEFDFTVGSLHGLRVWNLEPAGQLRGSYGGLWADGENLATCAKAEEMKGLILVLATEKAFLHWCHDQRINPGDPRIHRVGEPQEMKGFPEDTRWIEINDGFMPLSNVARKRDLLTTLGYAKADYARTRDRLKRPDNPHPVPGPNGQCGCGFWAYWTPQHANSVFSPSRPVMGLVEGYGKTRIGDRGFRAEKARIIAVCVMFDWEGDDGQLRSLTEMRIEHRYPSVKVYDTLDCMIALHPPTTDYLPQPETRTVAEVRVPQLMCPMGIPLGTIERNMLMVPQMAQPELKAWHADGSDCEHLPRFLASGGKATIVHGQGHVTISYSKGGQGLSPAIGRHQVATVLGGGGGGASWTAPANVMAADPGWRPVVPAAKFDQALSKALTHHPDGRPRITGGNSKFP